MLSYIAPVAVFALLTFLAIKYLPAPGMPTRLDFVPVEGKRSNYFDCEAVASDGTFWKSVNGIWETYK